MWMRDFLRCGYGLLLLPGLWLSRTFESLMIVASKAQGLFKKTAISPWTQWGQGGLLFWKENGEPGEVACWWGAAGRNRQGVDPMRASVPSRVLDLEILADFGYFGQEGVSSYSCHRCNCPLLDCRCKGANSSCCCCC